MAPLAPMALHHAHAAPAARIPLGSMVPARPLHWALARGSGPIRGPSVSISAGHGRLALAAGQGVGGTKHFSAAAARAAAADGGLVEALQAEIAHEHETYEAPEEVAAGPPKPFSVEATPGATELVLRRSFEGEDIAVIVSQSEEGEGDDLEDAEGEGAEAAAEEEEEEFEDAYIPVRISVTKKAADGSLRVLEFDCGIEGEKSTWVIEGVRLGSPSVSDDSIAYLGPDYYTLDPALQEQFGAYLVRRGFTPELGDYVKSALEHKEQEEYVSWLKRVKEFIATKSA